MTRTGAATGIPTSPGYVSGTYLIKLIELARAEGVDPAIFTTGVADVDPETVSEDFASAEMTYDEYLTCVKALTGVCERETLGLDFASLFTVKDYGILGYALLSCRDLRQGLQTFQNFNDLFGDVAELDRQFTWSDTTVAYWCVGYQQHEAARRFEMQTLLGQFVLGMRTLLEFAEEFAITSVAFSFSRPADVTPYEELFGQKVTFDAPRTEIRLDPASLNARFALRNEEARTACEAQCELMNNSMHRSGALSEQVRQMVLRSPGNIPDVETVAGSLHMSARSLRRRLAEEQSSFQSIISDVRDHLACRYLRETNLAIKEIGYLIGYSEVANFQRAFKSRIGQTPGEYRAARDDRL